MIYLDEETNTELVGVLTAVKLDIIALTMV